MRVTSRGAWTWGAIALAFLIGAYLRVWHVADQVVQDDEWHTLNAALRHEPWFLATHYRSSDVSIPLSIWDWLLIHTIGLEEWGFRLPMIVAGIAIVPVMAMVVWRWIGRLGAVMIAWLVATSPVLIMYSRFSRPYIIVALLGFAAIAAWEAWRRTRVQRWGTVSAACGAAAIFLNLFAAPAMLAVWGAGLIEAKRARRFEPGAPQPPVAFDQAKRHVRIGVIILAVLLAPGIISLVRFARGKVGVESPPADIWWQCAQVDLGAPNPFVRAWLVLSVALGVIVLVRRAPRFVVFLTVAVVAEIAAFSCVRPLGSQFPIVAARYTIVALPAVLVLVAVGLARQIQGATLLFRSRASLSAVATALGFIFVMGTIIARGPLREIYHEPNNFTNSLAYYQVRFAPSDVQLLPSFYERLRERKPSELRLVECPWVVGWGRLPYEYYQRQHRQRVRVATMEPLLRHDGLRFKSLIPVDPASEGLRDADYVIVHGDVVAEWFATIFRGIYPRFDPEGSLLCAQAGDAIKLLRKEAGFVEVFQDEWVTVFAPAEKAPRADGQYSR